MSDTVKENPQSAAASQASAENMPNNSSGPEQEESRTPAGNFREASYIVLFIAAVFVINAMETGSYRTPWPVAIGTLIAGLGLFGYSWYLQSRSRS